ncbi:phage protein, partial [Salmonella enterica]|uniref:phage protein n=1 Tax=Salmonella enterica TaxID=28901 RepID=UPI00398C518A
VVGGGVSHMVLLSYATAGREAVKCGQLGNTLQLISLRVIVPKGGSVSTTKIKYFLTSPKFVNINGVPYREAEATENLIG